MPTPSVAISVTSTPVWNARPAPGVHDHPHVGIGVELLPRDRELVAHLRRHRVEPIGTVVDQPADGTVALHDEAVEVRVGQEKPSVRVVPRTQRARDAPIARLVRGPKRPHRGGRVLRDLLRERLRLGAQPLGRVDDLAQDAELVRAPRREPLVATGERHAHDRLHRRLPHQRDRLVRGDLPDRDVRVEEGRVRRRDHDVGVGDEVQAAARAHAVDRGDHRLPHRVVPRGEAQLGPLRAPRLLAQRLGIAAQLDDVEAGLERGARSRC